MNKRNLMMLLGPALIVMLTLSLAACAPPTPEATPTPEEVEEKPRAVGIFAAPIATSPFDRSGCEGLMAMGEKYGFDATCIDQVEYAQVSDRARSLAADGVELVLFTSGGMASSLMEVPPEFPDTWFVLVSSVSELPDTDNAAGWDIDYFDMGFLAGVVAALQSDTGRAGCITGQDIPPTTNNCSGMYEGAKFMNPDFEVEVAYTGDWVDIARNKETAQAMIGRGADVFLAPAGAAGIGTIEAADEADLSAIGYIEDENYRAPDTVITSQLVNFIGIYDQLGELYTTGQLEPKIYPVTVAGGLIELAPFRGRVKEGVEEQTLEIMEQLQSGELEVERVIHDFTR